MEKSTKTVIIACIIVIILSFAIAFYIYPMMPIKMASHWNINDKVDGYMARVYGLLLMPVISVFMLLLFLFLPAIDPLKENIKKFRGYYDWFILLLIVFMFYLYILTIAWNVGYIFSMTRMIVPAFSALFYYAGVLVDNSKRNWFIGIRTPWTLSNDAVWKKTHKLGGKMFKISAFIALLGIFFKEYAMLFIIVPALFLVIYLVLYSYFEYKKETAKRRKIKKRR